jgi:hypothetical protein
VGLDGEEFHSRSGAAAMQLISNFNTSAVWGLHLSCGELAALESIGNKPTATFCGEVFRGGKTSLGRKGVVKSRENGTGESQGWIADSIYNNEH